MKCNYFDKRSDMTSAANSLMNGNALVSYRTRVMCACRYPFNFRHGILLVNSETDKVEYQLARCRACRKEVCGGTV